MARQHLRAATAVEARLDLLAPGFAERYQRCALQHALKVIGRFHQLELLKGKPGYLAYLPPVYGVARRALAALPDCRRGGELVRRWVPEMVDGAT